MAEDKDATWVPVFVLPNVSIEIPIERAPCALVPPDDPRVASLRAKHELFNTFLSSFTDNFGRRFEPQVMLLRADAPAAFRDTSALASFRDVIAAAAVPLCRAERMLGSARRGAFFSDTFAFYPWIIATNFELVVARTPALLGVDAADELQAQSSPALPHTRLREDDLDRPLLDALLDRWAARYGKGNAGWRDTALMRSLNMAYHASLMPGVNDATFLDTGRLICLWVSAFEILVHTGPGGWSSQLAVLDLLDSVGWQSEKLREKAHRAGKGGAKADRTLASWIYDQLYARRNDFLHGNPVSQDSLALPGSGRRGFLYAALLYRAALSAFLPLAYGVPQPPSSDPDAVGAWLAGKMDFELPARVIGNAILTAIEPEPTDDQ